VTSKARKPYLGLKRSLIEFFTAPVRYIKQSNEKESAFEKPYEGADYPSMHFKLPDPDWPTWKFDPTARRLPPSPEVLGTGSSCKHCDLSSYRIQADDCDTNAVNIYSSKRCVHEAHGFLAPKTWQFTSTDKPAFNEERQREIAIANPGLTAMTLGSHGQQWGETVLTVEALVGEIVDVQPGRWATHHPDIDVWVNPDVDEHVLLGTMIDDLGNICTELVEVSCSTVVCPPLVVFEFDDASTPDTIAPGGNITVYVTGGSAPYSWGAAGTGFTWASGVTTDPENVLTSASGD